MSTLKHISSQSSITEDISRQAKKLSQLADNLLHEQASFKPLPLDDFADAILSRRKALKMTGETVAELSGISSAAYRRIEQRKTSPRLETVIAICKTLGLKLCVM